MRIRIAGNRVTKLRDLSHCPAHLYTEGSTDMLDNGPMVGIVGTRSPTPLGNIATLQIIQTLKELQQWTPGFQNLVIISGLALGIDQLAHSLAIDHEQYSNIGVVAHGLDTHSPATTRPLRELIVESGGLIISEYPDGTPVRKGAFLERNRIIAALSDILIPIEATNHGGTADTVVDAITLGRQVIVPRWPNGMRLADWCLGLVGVHNNMHVIDDFFSPSGSGRDELLALFRALLPGSERA